MQLLHSKDSDSTLLIMVKIYATLLHVWELFKPLNSRKCQIGVPLPSPLPNFVTMDENLSRKSERHETEWTDFNKIVRKNLKNEILFWFVLSWGCFLKTIFFKFVKITQWLKKSNFVLFLGLLEAVKIEQNIVRKKNLSNFTNVSKSYYKVKKRRLLGNRMFINRCLHQ